LLERVRAELRLRHYSRRTEESYVHWIVRFLQFHGCRHPREMAATEVTAFLSHLAVAGRVAPATQNQALGALLFLYRRCWRSTCLGSTASSTPSVRRARRSC